MTDFWLWSCVGVIAFIVSGPAKAINAQEATAGQIEFFEKSVRPLLSKHCYQCHSTNSKRIEGGLKLDSRAAHLTGGDSGPSIVPGNAAESLLIEAVKYESYEMPPKGMLPDKDIKALERWVNMGAPWPEENAPESKGAAEKFDLEKRKSEFWVWQPIQTPQSPVVKDSGWPENEIDRFILNSLEQKSLSPAGEAGKAALLRRVYFDLVGLPPTPAQTEAFLADEDLESLERVVDRLLGAPQFGERWARHWMDSVRYAESRGHEFDSDIPNAFQYRDYIIRAFNQDVPYDQLVREHIAGDLLPEPRLHPGRKFNESVLGTGFWFLGEAAHSPVDIRKDEADRFDNMLDVMSKTFLGVTVSCARCHDHKFDAISTADYYSLSGFLQSSDYRHVRFESIEQNREVFDELAKFDKIYRDKIISLLKDEVEIPAAKDKIDSQAIVIDYGELAPQDFMQNGFIFGKAPRLRGQPYFVGGKKPAVKIATVSSAASDPIWKGLKAISQGVVKDRSEVHALPTSGRTLRSPTFELTSETVSCRVEGSGHVIACVDSHRLVHGPLHKETIVRIRPGKKWVKLNLKRYVGHRLHLEFIPDEATELSVQLVVQGLDKQQLAELDRRLASDQQKLKDYANKVESLLGQSEAAAEIVRDWGEARDRLSDRIVRRSGIAMAMLDGTGEDAQILIRGNASKPGEFEPRHFLTAVTGNTPMKIETGSGRLELADQINDSKNPLTSRVMVNRIWHHLMGRGIVPTVDDFGVLGQRPTHPELLDHLAIKFNSDGHSIKAMIKYIVLSKTYRLSSQPNQASLDADPTNLLWHHRPPRRLQGETIRDSLLSISGRLNPKMFGASVPINLTSFMEGRGKPKVNGPLDGKGRRSIYIAVRRNFLSPFMLTFDTPAPFSSMGRRNVSNVPAQALALLNDPLVVDLAGDWGKRAVEQFPEGPKAAKQRIEWLYESGFGRSPSNTEMKIAEEYVLQQLTKPGNAVDPSAAWGAIAHVLVNTKEFIFLR